MLQAIGRCREFTDRLSKEEFLADPRTQFAVLYNLQIIGEAANHLPLALRAASDEPWEKIIALRNRIVHGYTTVDMELIWTTVQTSLAPLEEELRAMQGSDDGSDG
jgi:uncharacterized protein with HEPN domain